MKRVFLTLTILFVSCCLSSVHSQVSTRCPYCCLPIWLSRFKNLLWHAESQQLVLFYYHISPNT
jgi:hypothetical protein